MRCPFCDFAGHRRAVHGHLAREHVDRVRTAENERLQLSYELACPVTFPGGPACDTAIKRIVNPRNRDPRFLEENAAEIRLVAFDQLLYHVEATHPELADEPVKGTSDA